MKPTLVTRCPSCGAEERKRKDGTFITFHEEDCPGPCTKKNCLARDIAKRLKPVKKKFLAEVAKLKKRGEWEGKQTIC